MHKLLLIDDDEDISAMLYLILGSKFEVAIINKSENIFNKVRSFLPDLILLDVFLTGYDGRVICKQLKFHPAYKHIPVILVSGHTDVVNSITKYGADDFIEKPFNAETLIAKIDMHLKINDLSKTRI